MIGKTILHYKIISKIGEVQFVNSLAVLNFENIRNPNDPNRAWQNNQTLLELWQDVDKDATDYQRVLKHLNNL